MSSVLLSWVKGDVIDRCYLTDDVTYAQWKQFILCIAFAACCTLDEYLD